MEEIEISWTHQKTGSTVAYCPDCQRQKTFTLSEQNYSIIICDCCKQQYKTKWKSTTDLEQKQKTVLTEEIKIRQETF